MCGVLCRCAVVKITLNNPKLEDQSEVKPSEGKNYDWIKTKAPLMLTFQRNILYFSCLIKSNASPRGEVLSCQRQDRPLQQKDDVYLFLFIIIPVGKLLAAKPGGAQHIFGAQCLSGSAVVP